MIGRLTICIAFVVALSEARTSAIAGALSETAVRPEDPSIIPNVIVEHVSDAPSRSDTPAPPTFDRDSDTAIDLVDVGEVVAVPESAQQGMFPPEKRMADRVVVGVEKNGTFVKEPTGVWTCYHISEEQHIVIQGIEEDVASENRKSTRPLLIITFNERDRYHFRKRYPLAVKTVRAGQSRIEAGMELRGGVRAISGGVKSRTYDVYMEIVLPGDDGKTTLVRGTFDEGAIPCLREDARKDEDDGKGASGAPSTEAHGE